MREPLVTDSQWEKIAPLLPQPRRRRRGRPPKPNRVVFEAILRILRSGARWRDPPRDFGGRPRCVLETAPALGGPGNLATDVANLPLRTG